MGVPLFSQRFPPCFVLIMKQRLKNSQAVQLTFLLKLQYFLQIREVGMGIACIKHSTFSCSGVERKAPGE
jgi:hypothetical protein